MFYAYFLYSYNLFCLLRILFHCYYRCTFATIIKIIYLLTYLLTDIAEKREIGPGPYGYDTSITSRGKIHTAACAITGRYADKGF